MSFSQDLKEKAAHTLGKVWAPTAHVLRKAWTPVAYALSETWAPIDRHILGEPSERAIAYSEQEADRRRRLKDGPSKFELTCQARLAMRQSGRGMAPPAA